MTEDVLLIDSQQNGICTITLNRPEVHNAFDNQVIQSLTQTLKKIDLDENVLIVILKAKGKNFSAGADLAWMQRMIDYTAEENLHDSLQLAILMKTLYHLSKPTIALAQGATIGGGIGLLACCDIAIATEDASFCFSEVKIGIIPAVISPYVISAIGKRTAQRYFMTAAHFSAKDAKAMQLITEIVKNETLDKKGIEVAQRLLKYSPKALSACKKLINRVSRGQIDEAMIRETAERIAEIRISKEGQEGLKAFLEKREAKW